MADGDPAKAVALASVLALMVGGIMIVAGVAKLGFVADLLSKPTVIGYMNGLALTILVSQLPKLFGFSVDADGFIEELVGFVRGRGRRRDRDGGAGDRGVGAGADGGPPTDAAEGSRRAAWSSSCRSRIAAFFDLKSRGVSLVGALPQGFPPFTIPTVSFGDLGRWRSARWGSPWCR